MQAKRFTILNESNFAVVIYSATLGWEHPLRAGDQVDLPDDLAEHITIEIHDPKDDAAAPRID